MKFKTSEENKFIKELGLPERGFKLDSKYNKGEYALYLKKDQYNFQAIAINFVTCDIEKEWGDFSNVDAEVGILFECTAFHDGVRHLEFNRTGCNMDGYVYYPSMKDLIEMLSRVREIELERCRDCER